MTTSDRARELEELLPCNEDRLCRPANVTMGGTPSPIHHGYKCVARLRPAILAYIQRKLDEAEADGELLAKVETLLLTHTDSLHVYWTSRDGRPQSGGTQYWLRWSDQTKDCGAPTLREALRKLVGEES